MRLHANAGAFDSRWRAHFRVPAAQQRCHARQSFKKNWTNLTFNQDAIFTGIPGRDQSSDKKTVRIDVSDARMRGVHFGKNPL